MTSVEDNAQTRERQGADSQSSDSHKGGLLATASILGALLASSCCLVPLVLVMLGISGAWISNLTVLAPFKPYFIAATATLLGFGFWYAFSKPKAVCQEGAYCGNSLSGRITKTALWLATVVVLLATTVNYWAPAFL